MTWAGPFTPAFQLFLRWLMAAASRRRRKAISNTDRGLPSIPHGAAVKPRNPTLEEQALARVHRLGQMREVTTVRFYMRDTFEERAMELQKKKEDLAGLLSDPQARNAEYLERLCGLL
ncbi:hypothetical protein F5Y14DRAFT_455698 [Nemania sp. NC0429]|nr:hypothetical protein F5Y14DRAFT_455698 [Nemania sp. NC0429]